MSQINLTGISIAVIAETNIDKLELDTLNSNITFLSSANTEMCEHCEVQPQSAMARKVMAMQRMQMSIITALQK